MDIHEADVPGVGKKFELSLDNNEKIIILVHHDGKREIYKKTQEDEDAEKIFKLSDRQARQIGSILEGTYFQPIETENIEVPLGEAIIEWMEVPSDSSLRGQTLEDAEIRQRIGVSIIAVQRGEETIPNPGPSFKIKDSDILVTLGTRDQQNQLEKLITGEDNQL